MEESREIRDIVLGMYHDWGRGDASFIDRLVSDRDDVLAIGTDPAEWWPTGRGFKAIWHRQFEEGIAGRRWIVGDLRAQSEGSVAWFADNPTSSLGDGGQRQWRVTGVLHREGAEWKIVQLHCSYGLPNALPLTTSIEAVADLVERDRPDLAKVAAPEGTVTIMFTDVEGSTSLNEAIGDDKFVPVLLAHHEEVRSAAEAHGGGVVKSSGDGFMLAFPSARRAVDCAIALQRGAAAIHEALRVRMGLHTGEPVRHADDFFGRDVAYAARIGSAAQGAEILVSSLVRSLVGPSGSVRFGEPRELELKGFDGPQQTFEVLWQ